MPKISEGFLLLVLLGVLLLLGGHATSSGQSHAPAGACPAGSHDVGGACAYP